MCSSHAEAEEVFVGKEVHVKNGPQGVGNVAFPAEDF